jgi:alkylhydroperoxidase family enzyme
VIEALLAEDLSRAVFSEAERRLLVLVEKVTKHAYRTTPEDIAGLREVGWSEPQIAEAVYVTALFAFFNRVADAFGIDSQGYGGPRLPSESAGS